VGHHGNGYNKTANIFLDLCKTIRYTSFHEDTQGAYVYMTSGGGAGMVDSDSQAGTFLAEKEFKALLTPELVDYYVGSIRAGLDKYADHQHYSAEVKAIHTDSVKAQIRNNLIVHEAELRLSKLGGQVAFRRTRGRPLFIMRDVVRSSFKKLDENLQTSNYPTQQALDFNGQRLPDQRIAINFPVAPAVLTNIIAGYRYDAVESVYEIFIVCPKDEEHLWVLPLTGAAVDDFMQAPEANPIAGKLLTIQGRKPRVKLRDDVVRREDEPTSS